VNLDLVVIAADKCIEQALGALLRRHAAIGIRPIRFTIRVHPHKDPGCHGTGHELARAFAREARHALVVFDRAWEGAPTSDRKALEADVVSQLRALWAERAGCIVIDPELEAWVWSDSPLVAEALGWRRRQPGLRPWLEQAGLWPAGRPKPPDPKTAFREAMRQVGLPPAAAVFKQLAESVSIERCTDEAMADLLALLRRWFAPGPQREPADR
jgi:hypothetical protein